MKLTSKALIKYWINAINEYARATGLKIDPLPDILILDKSEYQIEEDNLLISTGGYMPAIKLIVLYVDNRHLKDIIRSYCHELIHHVLNLDNSDYIRRLFNMPEDVVDNSLLEEIEGDAYLRGNLLLRKFTEHFKKSLQKKSKS